MLARLMTKVIISYLPEELSSPILRALKGNLIFLPKHLQSLYRNLYIWSYDAFLLPFRLPGLIKVLLCVLSSH